MLVACERSGVVRETFRRRGHAAYSCDLVPADDFSEHHLMCDALNVLNQGWDLMIAHPPCTYLSRAGARWWKDPVRVLLADKAWKEAEVTGYAPDVPPWLAVWLLIAADNTLHLTINFLALRYL